MTIDTIIGILKGRIDLYVDLGKGGKIQRHDILRHTFLLYNAYDSFYL